MWTDWNGTSSLRVYFVKWGQTTHQHVCYALLSRNACRTSSDHSWKTVVCKGKTLAFHTFDVVFKTRHTQCGIFCVLSPIFFPLLTVKTSLCMRIAGCYCCSDPTVCCRPPSADRHHLHWYIIGGTWERHRVTVHQLKFQFCVIKRNIGQDGKRPYLKTCDTNLICWRTGNNLDLAFWRCLVRTSASWPMCTLLSCRILLVWCTGIEHNFLFLNPHLLAYQFFFSLLRLTFSVDMMSSNYLIISGHLRWLLGRLSVREQTWCWLPVIRFVVVFLCLFLNET